MIIISNENFSEKEMRVIEQAIVDNIDNFKADPDLALSDDVQVLIQKKGDEFHVCRAEVL